MSRKPPTLDLPFVAPSAPPKRPSTSPWSSSRAPADDPREVLTVAALDRKLRRAIEGEVGPVRVQGEVAGKKEVASGHVYFTLKDEHEEALIEVVMYRTAPPRAKRLLVDGARVVVEGLPSVYIPRGRLQLIAEDARPLGRGALLEALERLKQQLASEGLFSPEKKRPLPTDAAVIGVVTSADGAAVHDIVTVAFRRGGVRILLARTPVQGPGAAERMARAIGLLERAPEVEVIIVGRGGGSAEDLAVYNDEIVVRKVAACRVPVVSAVGHEVDMTLVDLAADARAATPSQAAEMLVPDANARRRVLDQLGARIQRAFVRRVERERDLVVNTRRRLSEAQRRIDERQQHIDDLMARLEGWRLRAVASRRTELSRVERRLNAKHPARVVADTRAVLRPLFARLTAAAARILTTAREQHIRNHARLISLSPLAVLQRGYAIAERADGRAIRSPNDVSRGEALRVRLADGALSVVVSDLHPAPRESDA